MTYQAREAIKLRLKESLSDRGEIVVADKEKLSLGDNGESSTASESTASNKLLVNSILLYLFEALQTVN